MHGECNRTQPLDSSLAQPLPGRNTYHCASLLPTTSTVPWLSPISNSSPPVDGSCGSPPSFTGSSATTGPSSRDSSPESVFSTPPSSSLTCSPTSATLPPTSTSDDHTVTKRGLPAGRIKRPANAFMCFRTYFCKNKPRDVERHNATVSKITGIAWRRLSDEERVPYIAQAAAIKAEFTAKHPDWVFKPRRNRPMKRSRKTQQRTLADEQRYTRIALGFNSGKRGKDLKRLAEMAETAAKEDVPAPPSRIRRNRKSIGTTKASVSKPVVFTPIAPPSFDGTTQSVMEHSQIPVELPPSNLPEHTAAVPPSLPRHSLLQELQPVSALSRRPNTRIQVYVWGRTTSSACHLSHISRTSSLTCRVF
jgi:hypothetical protein